MDTKQKDKKKEKERDLPPGKRMPKVSGVDCKQTALFGVYADQACGRFVKLLHLFSISLPNRFFSLYCVRFELIRQGTTEPRPCEFSN
ncbi:hypothetical protein IGI04_037639 [Brassica rapa subsp. trilocularis]|uniref:Uncharacterized protein n=1 Tax=Brassica rapa subsp. trilocularis TaxID=1813537 RepID=A0ABQ7LI28_BRACM|nr:hypothetical protein IGI04_037639 [Brassica rapa subsp. trilocularis]